MQIADVSLDDKYTRTSGRIYCTGIQALVRILLVQSQRDRRARLRTAGFVSGYRGSPLGGLDQQLWRARAHLDAHAVHFSPGLNEELAATAVWGSQQLAASPGARAEGVFALWYGKAPGVDRAGDVLKHANAAGSARHGGVLVVAGDDHECKSSTLPSQSEYAMLDAGIPVLNPSNVQEVLDYGVLGWALSRFSGCWAALVALADTMDSSATVHADLDRVQPVSPEDFLPPPGGVHFRVGRSPLEQEELLHGHKLPAALAFARANRLDRVVLAPSRPRLGIVTTGKSYLDVRQALDDLGLGEAGARELGIAVYKVGMPWPLEAGGLRAFAEGLEELLVVEEKRGLIEGQVKEHLFDVRADRRPRVVGKRDERGAWLLPASGGFGPGTVARAIASRIAPERRTERMRERFAQLERAEAALAAAEERRARQPFYCSGCPHNVSTRLPAGSRGLAGIGCHYMVRWMDRNTDTFSQMGGEGVHWLGQAPFTDEEHVFANLGDGTYTHSGSLAVRAAVAAGANLTFKLLFNDAVAMTGGQKTEGHAGVAQVTRQLAAEGVRRIAVVADDPARHRDGARLAPGTTLHHRDELGAVQRALRETPGVSALVYDQTCAAELRRRRKRGIAPDPPRRVFINEAVCEGCGDCSEQSSCVSIEPLETEFGRKRTINQTSCNKDFSCLNGLCPAFVSVHGGRLRRVAPSAGPPDEALAAVPVPRTPPLDEPWNGVVTGIGGTGVVTIGALLGMAAHLEGKGSTVLDMTGLAQKGGAVISYVRIGAGPEAIHTPRVPAGEADALLACDLVVAAGREATARLDAARTRSVVNTHLAPTAEFVMDNRVRYDAAEFLTPVRELSAGLDALDVTRLATALLGDAVAANVFLLGYAYQKGLVPLSAEALEGAIALNGVAVEANARAFRWGRLAAHDPATVEAAAGAPAPEPALHTLDEAVARRERELTAYQGRALARRYRDLVEAVREAESRRTPGHGELVDAVTHGFFRLLATKDEYEVARLYTNGEFERRLREQFEGDFSVRLELAPPLWAALDPATGRPRKRSYGRWMWHAMRVLTRLRFLRGTPLDPFGYTEERRLERRLAADYERTLRRLLETLDAANHATAVEIAALPDAIRGFGAVKLANARAAREREAELLDRYFKDS